MQIHSYDPHAEAFQNLLHRGGAARPGLLEQTAAIIARVRAEGDAGLVALTAQFDQVEMTPAKLRVDEGALAAAAAAVEMDFLTAVTLARVNIRRFHEYQRRAGYLHPDGDGVTLAKRVLPLAAVGIYVPAGSAPLFSTLLMCAVPAQIAGVARIVVCAAPQRNGEIAPHILATAHILGLTEVYRVGGAQAIAAMAYGTESIARVDKVVGPGGPFVNMAKRLVFGDCGIDALAGPSELVIIADKTAPTAFVAADFLSQLEHGSGYEAAVLLTASRDVAEAVRIELSRQLASLARAEQIKLALSRSSAAFVCPNLQVAIEAANLLAPEHLEIMTADADALLPEVRNAGAVFIGAYAGEAVGDYFAGTNHVLPTAGSARFMSSLSVYDFFKDLSIIRYTPERLLKVGRHIINLARTEGLTAHAAAIKVRLDKIQRGGNV